MLHPLLKIEVVIKIIMDMMSLQALTLMIPVLYKLFIPKIQVLSEITCYVIVVFCCS